MKYDLLANHIPFIWTIEGLRMSQHAIENMQESFSTRIREHAGDTSEAHKGSQHAWPLHAGASVIQRISQKTNAPRFQPKQPQYKASVARNSIRSVLCITGNMQGVENVSSYAAHMQITSLIHRCCAVSLEILGNSTAASPVAAATLTTTTMTATATSTTSNTNASATHACFWFSS